MPFQIEEGVTGCKTIKVSCSNANENVCKDEIQIFTYNSPKKYLFDSLKKFYQCSSVSSFSPRPMTITMRTRKRSSSFNILGRHWKKCPNVNGQKLRKIITIIRWMPFETRQSDFSGIFLARKHKNEEQYQWMWMWMSWCPVWLFFLMPPFTRALCGAVKGQLLTSDAFHVVYWNQHLD